MMTTLNIVFKHLWSRVIFLLIAGLLFLLAFPATADDLPLADYPHMDTINQSDNTYTPDYVAWCPSPTDICRVNRQWTVEELQPHLTNKDWAIWQENDQLIFAFRGRADDVFVIGGIETSLIPVANSPYWVATIQIRNLDHALVTHLFGVVIGENRMLIGDSYGIWRGEHAPNPPEVANPLTGILWTTTIYSPALDDMRAVSFYLPPTYQRGQTYPVVYMTDGESIGWFAEVVEPLIEDGTIPPMIMVGVHSGNSGRTRDQRSEEYILGFNEDVYRAHEQFFTQTVRRYAELTFGASQEPSQRAVMGFSSGAVFAGNAGVRKPDLYGHVMMFSPGYQPQLSLRSRIEADYFLLAGTLEPSFYRQAQHTFLALLLLEVDVHFTQRVAGHDGAMWQEEFTRALRWMFFED